MVYCRDDDRRGHALHETFDFLGYTFRARRSKNRWGKYFVNFSPAVSNAAAKRMRREIRAWQLGCRVDKRIDDLARMFNPIIRGWLTYYGRYYPSGLYPTLQYLDRRLARWAEGKYKRLRAASPALGAPDTGHRGLRPGALCPLALVASSSGWTVRAG